MTTEVEEMPVFEMAIRPRDPEPLPLADTLVTDPDSSEPRVTLKLNEVSADGGSGPPEFALRFGGSVMAGGWAGGSAEPGVRDGSAAVGGGTMGRDDSDCGCAIAGGGSRAPGLSIGGTGVSADGDSGGSEMIVGGSATGGGGMRVGGEVSEDGGSGA